MERLLEIKLGPAPSASWRLMNIKHGFGMFGSGASGLVGRPNFNFQIYMHRYPKQIPHWKKDERSK